MMLVDVVGTCEYKETIVLLLKSRLKQIGTTPIRRLKTNWIAAELLMLGESLGFRALPEYPVVIKTKSGKGFVDVVWLRNEEMYQGFEITFSHGKPRDIAKLTRFQNGTLVQLGETGLKKKNVRKANRYLSR